MRHIMSNENDFSNISLCPDSEIKLQNETNAKFSRNPSMMPDSEYLEHNWNLEVYTDDEPYNTPVEILSEFLFAFMSHDYKSALHYCTLILQYEPDNKLIQDFYPLIQEKLHFDSYDSDEFADSERSNSSSRSDNSTEYFSSTSPDVESTSAFSSFSSEEEMSQN